MASIPKGNNAVMQAAGAMPRGIRPATYPAASRNAPPVPHRAGVALDALGSGVDGFDPTRNHVTLSEHDRRTLGVLPRGAGTFPYRSVSKG